MIRHAKGIVPVLLIGIIIVSIWTPLAHGAIARRWFALPDLFFFAPVPILVLATSWLMLRLLNGGSTGEVPPAGPFLLSVFLLFLGYTGLAISLWPNIIPPSISIDEAAAPPPSMGFASGGARFVVPS